MDDIEIALLDTINAAPCHEPFGITDLLDIVKKKITNVTRAMIIYRLVKLRGNKKIHGKMIGNTRGTWVYWKKRTRKKKELICYLVVKKGMCRAGVQ